MAKLTLVDTSSGYNSLSVRNANNTLIEAAIENTLSRDGTAPNQMAANLDMNSNKVTNLTDGTNNQDAVTVSQLASAVLSGSSFAQTPWVANIDADGYNLTGVVTITVEDATETKSGDFSHDAFGYFSFDNDFGAYFLGSTYCEVSSQVTSGTANYAEHINYQIPDGTNAQFGLSGSTATYEAGKWWIFSIEDGVIDSPSVYLKHSSGAADPVLRIYDGSSTDYSDFSHDGTDFNTDFTTTVDWNITGLTGALKVPVLDPGTVHITATVTTALEDITAVINTANKVEGTMYFNGTTNKPVWAVGSAAGDVWVDATGATAHTPV